MIPPTDTCLEAIQAIGPKIGTRKFVRDTLWQKFCPCIRFICRVNQRTQFSRNCKNGAMNYVPAERNCQKTEWFPIFSESAIQTRFRPCHPDFFPPIKPLLALRQHPATLALFVSPGNWQTWRWRVQEKAAESGQCGMRPHRSALGSYSPERP